MKHFATGKSRREFDVLHATRGAQAAVMTLQPGAATGDAPENEHPWAEQWLYVVSGSGRARIAGRSVGIRSRSLLLIEKGESHRIRNTGRSPLVTVNFYIPPAYTRNGELR